MHDGYRPPASSPALFRAKRPGWYGRWAGAERYRHLIAGIVVALGFCWRLWLAHATFFNTDEAWHWSVANQDSLHALYQASLTLAHPPLLVFLLFFWRHLGTSDAMLRLPGVLAGTIFCWVLYKWLARLFGGTVAWAGLIFATFLPPMIALSAELRQYTLMLMFAVSAAYFLERALAENSVLMMLLSSSCLYLAMLSHYSAFLFAAALGIYAILRMLAHPPSQGLIALWASSQIVGIGLAAFLYFTYIAKLAAVYPGDPLRRFGDFYLNDVYFHAGKEHLHHFLYRGTFGVFRFMCGQRTGGHLTTVLFVVGVVLLFWTKAESHQRPPARLTAVFLMIPFLLSWVTVLADLYPYGRTRQCVFLAVFGIAGVSITLARIAKDRIIVAVCLAVGVVAICHLFSKPYALDLRATSDQRREHMHRAVQFIRSEVTAADVIFTDKPTSFQLQRYLCQHKPSDVDQSVNGYESFRCDGLRIVSTELSDGSLTPQNFAEKLNEMERGYSLSPRTAIWVVQAAWSRGLAEALQSQSAEFAGIQPHSFDYYIAVFKLP